MTRGSRAYKVDDSSPLYCPQCRGPKIDVRAHTGTNLRRMREGTGLSQEALADAATLNRTYVGGIERGRRNPTVVVLDRLAVALNVIVSELVVGLGRRRPE